MDSTDRAAPRASCCRCLRSAGVALKRGAGSVAGRICFGLMCLGLCAAWVAGQEDWVFGPGRFRSSTGVGLEVASFALTLFNVCLEIFDYYNSNRVWAFLPPACAAPPRACLLGDEQCVPRCPNKSLMSVCAISRIPMAIIRSVNKLRRLGRRRTRDTQKVFQPRESPEPRAADLERRRGC